MRPSINAFHCLLSDAYVFQVVPSFAMPPCHLLLGHPLDLPSHPGCPSMQHLVHLLSFILAICPAHFLFCFSVYSLMSIIFVHFLISEHGTLSCSFNLTFFSPFALWALLCQLFIKRACLASIGHCPLLVFEWYGELSILKYFLVGFFFPKPLHADPGIDFFYF